MFKIKSEREKTDEQKHEHAHEREIVGKRRPSPYLQILKKRNFFLLWLGQAISNFGDWIIVVAMIALVYNLSKSPLAISVLMIARLAPAVVFGSFVGVVVDRVNRKWLMIGCDVARGLLILTLPFIRNFYGLIAVAFILETFSLLFMPAKDASIPNIVEEDDVLIANSLSGTTNYATMILGSGAAGAVLAAAEAVLRSLPIVSDIFGRQFAGTSVAFLLDSLTFFVSAVTISLISIKAQAQLPTEGRLMDLRRDLASVAILIRTNPLVRPMLISIGVAILGGGSIYALGVDFSNVILKVGSAGFGFLLAALGVGLVIGAALASLFGRLVPKDKLFSSSLFFLGAFLLVFSLIPIYEISIVMLIIAGVNLAMLQVTGYTLIHENLPDEVRGRIFGVMESIIRISLLISLGFTGIVAQGINRAASRYEIPVNGSQATLVLGAVVIIVAGLFALRTVRVKEV
ncbi:MAG: MFS transporter [Actinobacteria bacterium]|nr:MFS transporter [Actinomycetota bacterium]